MTRNIRIVPDIANISSLTLQSAANEYDVLIVPGGGPGAETFCTTPSVLDLISQFRSAGTWVAAICAGTTALVTSGNLYGGGKSKVTSHPSVADKIKEAGWEYSEERVVVDGKVITSRGCV
jgi:protein DJ-1